MNLIPASYDISDVFKFYSIYLLSEILTSPGRILGSFKIKLCFPFEISDLWAGNTSWDFDNMGTINLWTGYHIILDLFPSAISFRVLSLYFKRSLGFSHPKFKLYFISIFSVIIFRSFSIYLKNGCSIQFSFTTLVPLISLNNGSGAASASKLLFDPSPMLSLAYATGFFYCI